MTYHAAENRYDTMQYRTCGRSGLKLPLLSLGLWHNFGDSNSLASQRDMLRTAFDLASRISTWRTTTARRTAVRKAISASCCATISCPTAMS